MFEICYGYYVRNFKNGAEKLQIKAFQNYDKNIFKGTF